MLIDFFLKRVGVDSESGAIMSQVQSESSRGDVDQWMSRQFNFGTSQSIECGLGGVINNSVVTDNA